MVRPNIARACFLLKVYERLVFCVEAFCPQNKMHVKPINSIIVPTEEI